MMPALFVLLESFCWAMPIDQRAGFAQRLEFMFNVNFSKWLGTRFDRAGPFVSSHPLFGYGNLWLNGAYMTKKMRPIVKQYGIGAFRHTGCASGWFGYFSNFFR